MSIYDTLVEWLKGYQPLNNWIYINAVPMIAGTTSLNPVQGDRVTAKYIDGTIKRTSVNSIDMVTQYDREGTSDINKQALDEVENFIKWIEATTKPVLDEGLELVKLEVTNNVPSVLVDNTNMLAKYQFQISLEYLDKKGAI